jgi:predicted Kef-type K+ transport protein
VITLVLVQWLLRALTDLPLGALLAAASMLAFSSTVLAAKILEQKREMRAFHGRVAIGILIVQDVIAVAILGMYGASQLDWPAAFVLLLPLLKWPLEKLLSLTGHGELLVLLGAVLALGIGGYGFEAIGLSSELGALLTGMLLANHPRVPSNSATRCGA